VTVCLGPQTEIQGHELQSHSPNFSRQ